MTSLSHAYGRRPPKRHPALRLAPLLTGAIPLHPAADDNLTRLSNWQMLGNDSAGDCVAVTWANFRRLVTALLAEHEVYPTQDQVWAIYRTQNPSFDPNSSTHGPGSNDDQGMDIQTLLEYLVKQGGPDGVKAVAFAAVDYTNLEEFRAALAIFGGVWTGINVLSQNEDEFSAGKPWDWSSSSQNVGGHSILSGGYTGKSTGDVTFITWAEETSFTDRFIQQGGVEEAWVVIWPEHLGNKEFLESVDLAALAADYKAITGKVLPIPTPAPTPTPTPDPTPVPVPSTGVTPFPHADVDPWLNAKCYTLKGKAAQKAIRAWLAANPGL